MKATTDKESIYSIFKIAKNIDSRMDALVHGYFYQLSFNLKHDIPQLIIYVCIVYFGSREVFENIHIYPLLVHILGLEPYAEIDGDLDVVKDMLAD